VTKPAQSTTRKMVERGAAILASVIGIALGKAFGAIFWLPTLLVSIAWFVLTKAKVSNILTPMLAILIGHTGWMLIGFATLFATRGNADVMIEFAPDFIAVVGLSVWILVRQSVPGAVGVLTYEVAALVYLVINADEQRVTATAIIMHFVLRILGACAAIYAIVMLNRSRSAPQQEWFVSDDRGRMGPFTKTQLIETLATFPERDEVLVKRIGQKSWERVGDIPELRSQTSDHASVPTPQPPSLSPELRPNPVPAVSKSRAKWRWMRNGAVVGLVLGAFALIAHPKGNDAAVLGYVFGFLVLSVALCSVIGFLAGAARDLLSRRPPSQQSITKPPGPQVSKSLNVISMHWYGHYPLWISYWVVNVIASIVTIVVATLIAAAFTPKSGYDPLAAFGAIAGFWFCILAIEIWQIVGLWRSANKYVVKRSSIGKKAPWAVVAKIAVSLGVIQIVASVVSSGLPQLSEATRIAFMGDPDIPEYSFRIMRNGTEVEITGGFKYGLTDDFSKLLKASRQISVVHLTSVGGRIGEAEKLYKLIREGGLDTYVPDRCLSACTIAFAGGRERYIAQGAILGFHAPAFPGTSNEELKASVAEQTEIFKASGFSSDFIDHALNTASSDMWTPSTSELLTANVITGVSNGTQFAASGLGDVTKKEMGEKLAKALPLLDALRERLPQSYDSVIDAFYASYVAGNTWAAALSAARAKLLPILSSLQPLANDDVLSDLARLMADQYQALELKNPTLCYLYASGTDTNRDYVNELPSALLSRELELSDRVVRTAVKRAPAPGPELDIIWKKLARTMTVNGLTEEQLGLLNANNVPPSKYHQYCTTSIALFNAINKLPQKDAAAIMRSILAAR
jgi:hypothetical protein